MADLKTTAIWVHTTSNWTVKILLCYYSFL